MLKQSLSAALSFGLSVSSAFAASQIPVTDEMLTTDFKADMVKRLNLSAKFDFQTLSVIPADEFKEILGKGFDVFEGKVKNEPPCVEASGDNDHDTLKDKLAPSYGTYWSDTVAGMSSHQSASGTSAGFDVTYKMLSLGFETGSRSENFFNSSDGFGRVVNRIVTRVKYRDGGKWSNSAENDLKNGNVKAFLKRCASHYIQAIYFGHLIDETLWFELRNDKRTSSDSDKLSFGIKGLLSLGTSDTESSASVKSLAIARNERMSRGIVATQLPPPKDVDAVASLVDFGKYEFGNQVSAAPIEKSAILLVNVVPYRERSLPRVDKIPDWPDRVFSLMEQKTNVLYQLMTAISDLRYAKGLDQATYEKLYTMPAYGELAPKLDKAVEIRETYKKAIDECRKQMLADTDTGAEAICRAEIKNTLQQSDIAAIMLTRKHGP